MSYIRCGHELEDFEGESYLYIYLDGDKINDYHSGYSDNASFAQLCLNMFKIEIKDKEYIEKIKRALAKKLDVEVRK